MVIILVKSSIYNKSPVCLSRRLTSQYFTFRLISFRSPFVTIWYPCTSQQARLWWAISGISTSIQYRFFSLKISLYRYFSININITIKISIFRSISLKNCLIFWAFQWYHTFWGHFRPLTFFSHKLTLFVKFSALPPPPRREIIF